MDKCDLLFPQSGLNHYYKNKAFRQELQLENEGESAMDIRDYEYIVAIAEQGCITRAAAQLFITQSALTKFLQRMEKSLGIALFVKKGNQFLLTEAGRQYVETGRQIMQLDRKLESALAREVTVQKKRIRFGYGMGRSSYMLEQILPRFYEQYPDTCVYASADTSRHHMADLEHDRLDLALLTNVEKNPGYQYLPVERSRLALAVPEDSLLPAKAQKVEGYPYPVIDREELKGLRFVSLPTTTNSGNLMRDWMHRYGVNPDIVLEISDVRSLIDAVECGLGAAMFLSVPVGTRRIRYLSIRDTDAVEQMTALVFKAGKNLSPAMNYLISLITGKMP